MISHVVFADMNLARILRLNREDELTPREVASTLGVAEATARHVIKRVKTGVAPSYKILEAVATYERVNPAQLLLAPDVSKETKAKYNNASIDYIAANLRHYRARDGISVDNLASRAHMQRAIAYKYERGVIPSLPTLQNIADAFSVEVIDLLQPVSPYVTGVEYALEKLKDAAPDNEAAAKAYKVGLKNYTFNDLNAVARSMHTNVSCLLCAQGVNENSLHRWSRINFNHIGFNIGRLRVKRGLSITELYGSGPVWEKGSVPDVLEVARIAEVLEVEMLDLLKEVDARTRNKYGDFIDLGDPVLDADKITHIKYAYDKLIGFLNTVSYYDVSMRSGVSTNALFELKKDTLDSYMKRASLKTSAAVAEVAGLSIGNLFLKPGVETAWYDETSIEYLGQNIKALRDEVGLPQMELAKRIGCTCGSLWTYETGQSYPKLERIQAIADELRVEVSELFLPPEEEEE